MSSAREEPAGGETQFYVHRHPGPTEAQPLAELARVTIGGPVTTIEGDEVAAGTEGTIVAAWADGGASDVEFADALGPATVEAAFVKRAESP